MSTTNPSTSLTEATNELRAGLAGQLGEERLAVLDRDATEMATRFENALGVGDAAPVFTLPNARGESISLEDLLVAGSVVLVFYRGAWCPYCNLQLAAFQGELGEIRAAGATLVGISPQTPDASLSFADSHALEFPVLSDSGNRVAAQYGLRFTHSTASTAILQELGVDNVAIYGDDSNTLPAATTYVIQPDGTISFAAVSGDFRWRVGPEEVLAALAS